MEKTGAVYELDAVYGGGNMAAYEPVDLTNGKTEVIIDGCELTSIQYVYGGGNAASVPATNVTINGCYEIGYVFGGGNGRDNIIVNGQPQENPGADIGYKDNGTASYGSGVSLAVLHGGTIHNAFGGSNTKGNVRASSTVKLDEKDPSETDYCPLVVEEVYGAGNEAEQDGTAEIDLGCTPGLPEIYGGGYGASATVTGDTYVNINECIGDKHDAELSKTASLTGNRTITFTEIENNTEVTKSIDIYLPPHTAGQMGSIGIVFGGGNAARVLGSTHVNIGTDEVIEYVSIEDDTTTADVDEKHPAFSGASIIGNVYGGGNKADVTGDTKVTIGKKTE